MRELFPFVLASVAIVLAVKSAEGQNPPTGRSLVSRVDPSIVTIETKTGLGSGFIISAKGVVLTNYHVIEGAKEAVVITAAKERIPVAGFFHISPGRDIAILALEPSKVTLTPIEIAKAAPQRGDRVFAFGSPRGFSGSVSDGIVSAFRTGEELSATFQKMLGVDFYREELRYDLDAQWIQTSALITHGNSGGPLVNESAEVVGMNTWGTPGATPLNFAVSSVTISRSIGEAAQTSRRLTELPAPRDTAIASPKGDPKATAEHWSAKSKILGNLELLLALPENVRDHPVLLRDTYRYHAKRFADAATQFEQIEIRRVDPELLAFTEWDSQHFREVSRSMSECASAVQFCIATATTRNAALKIQASDGLTRTLERHSEFLKNNRRQELLSRLTARLSLRYGWELGPKRGPAGESEFPSDHPLSIEAKKHLELAKALLDAGNSASANKRLREIVDTFNRTAAGREAAALLKSP